MIEDPIWFHVNKGFFPERHVSPVLEKEVREFFERTIGNGKWLRPGADTYHFSQKFPTKAANDPAFTVLSTKSHLPGIVVIYAQHKCAGDVVALRIELSVFMANRRIGCFAPFEEEPLTKSSGMVAV